MSLFGAQFLSVTAGGRRHAAGGELAVCFREAVDGIRVTARRAPSPGLTSSLVGPLCVSVALKPLPDSAEVCWELGDSFRSGSEPEVPKWSRV